MDHLLLLLQLKLLILVPETTKGLPMLLPVHILDLVLNPLDHLHHQQKHRHPIPVPETTRLLPMVLPALTLDLLHNPVDP